MLSFILDDTESQKYTQYALLDMKTKSPSVHFANHLNSENNNANDDALMQKSASEVFNKGITNYI